MVKRCIFIFLIIIITSCLFFSNPCYSETDTLKQGQELKDWDELISSNRVFGLRFFGFGTNISPYLGLFYENNRHGGRDRSLEYGRLEGFGSLEYGRLEDFRNKAVWVANRNNPVTDAYGKLVIDVHGKLSISSGGGTVVDLFNPTPLKIRNVSATLLDSGNLVLQERYPDGSVKQVLWQSFDYPTDTLLPGMKLGTNLKSGHRWSLTSWAGVKLPAHGSFTLSGDPNGTGQLVLLRRENIRWMSGPWRNGQFENTNMQSSGSDVHLYYTYNETEQSFTYLTKTCDTFPVLRMYPDGQLKSSTLKLDVTCRSINDPGCAEYEFEELKCRKHYYFPERYIPYGTYARDSYISRNDFIYLNEYAYDESDNMTLYDCKRICWNNCSCTAYSYATKHGTGCKTYAKMIYNPAEADQDTEYFPFFFNAGEKKQKWIWIWIVVVIGSLAPLIWLSCYLVYKKLHHVRGKGKKIQKLLLPQLRRFYNYVRKHKEMNTELYYFTFQSISSATNSFSSTNKLGEGGFGAVYKGKLADGQEVAVKRLSRSSAQGVKEFKNETELIAKLQHINLVRLLGCCIEKQEKILVYEYMPNNSLDFFLFDPRKKGLLNWNSRFVIIDGIAQGLLYLHKFSRLRVIHRDLKASNILLDDYLKPKISDFGMAKLFGINESEENTSRVVGTRGYMPPEYLIDGTISTKIDVFGFGVLLLEIVSSKKNHGSYDVEHPLNLLGHAWELWNEGRGLELMDPILEDSSTPKEVMTCIHVGLLCVQDNAADRPTMSEVISMLTNENMHLPEPKQPAFFIERQLDANAEKEDKLGNGSTNGQSISILVAR